MKNMAIWPYNLLGKIKNVNIISKVLSLTAGLILIGCTNNNPPQTKPDKAVIEAAEMTRYSNLQLCQAADALVPSLNVNPASHPEFNENLRRSKVLQAEISSRNVNCYKLKAENSKPTTPLTSRQKQARASAVCRDNAYRSQFADPSVLLEMCTKGFQSPQKSCTKNTASFNLEAQKLTGVARAEYIEISNAFRMGCNMK